MDIVAFIAQLLELTNDAERDVLKALDQLGQTSPLAERYVLKGLEKLGQTSPLAETMELLAAEISNHYDMLQEVSKSIVRKDVVEVIPENLLIDCRETLKSLIRLMQDCSNTPKIWLALRYSGRQRQMKSLMRNLRLFNWNFEIILNKSNIYDITAFRDLPSAQHIQSYDLKYEDSEQRARREEILSWISPHDFDAKHRRERKFQRIHTREWLIKSSMYSSWRMSGSGVFILISYPGTGESDLYLNVVEELRRITLFDPRQAVAYFYIDRFGDARQALNRLISTFLRQLLQQLPILPLDIIRIYEKTGLHGRKLTYAELIEQLISVAKRFRQVYFCFDGLDELADEEQQSLLGLIGKFSEAKICVFISSSRFTRQIYVFFQESLLEADSLYPLVISRTEEYAEGVTRYVQLRVLLSERYKRRFGLPKRIIRKIDALSQGMFLRVVLVLQSWMRALWEYRLRPALGGEMPLEPGMTRVRWTCVCDRRYYDDFIEIESGAIAEVQALLHDIYRREPQTVPAEPASLLLLLSNRERLYIIITTMTISIMPIVIRYIVADVSVRDRMEWPALFLLEIATLATIVTFMMRPRRGVLNRANSTFLERLTPLIDNAKFSSPDIDRTFSEFPVPDYLGLHVKAQKFDEQTQDGNASQKQTAGISQLPGLNFLESGDVSIQRVPAESTSDGGRSKQDLELTEARTHNWPVVEQWDTSFGQALWVIACFRNSKGDDQVVQVRVGDRTKDSTLFSRFRKEYFRISSWWRRFVKMQEVTAIRFVMLGLVAGDEPQEHIADIRQVDVWPPKAEPQTWLYHPCPAVHTPLVGPRYLMKIWREPHHANRDAYENWRREANWWTRATNWIRHAFPRFIQKMLGDWGLDPKAGKIELGDGVGSPGLSRGISQQPTPAQRSRYAIIAIPKKIGNMVELDLGAEQREEAWGLQFEESFTIHRLLFYILVLYFLGSIVAVVHLFQEETGPVSMAYKLWIFSWIASFVTLLLTVWLKWAETPK